MLICTLPVRPLKFHNVLRPYSVFRIHTFYLILNMRSGSQMRVFHSSLCIIFSFPRLQIILNSATQTKAAAFQNDSLLNLRSFK